MDTYTDAYTCDLSDAKKYLRKYGIAVIPKVVSRADCKEIIATLWDNLSYATSNWETPITKEDKSSWDMDDFTLTKGLIGQHHSMGHWQAVWDVRQHPNVVNVFSEIWDTKPKDLLCSFDGISISFPPERTGKGWFIDSNAWPHCDTSYNYETTDPKDCIQGWFTPVKVRKGDATLAFYTYSHLYHKKFAKKYGITEKKDWYPLNEEQTNTYVNKYGCTLERIMCPAGSVVLWDSKTIHYGQKPMKGREKSNIRMVIYVCMMPRDRATEANIKKKQKYFKELRMTSHNPVKPRLFSKEPWVRGDKSALEEILPPPKPKLTKLGKRLAGF